MAMQPGDRVRCTPCAQRVKGSTTVCDSDRLCSTDPVHCLRAQGWIKAGSGSWWCPACARDNGVTKDVRWHLVYCHHRRQAGNREASSGASAQSSRSAGTASRASAGGPPDRPSTPPRMPTTWPTVRGEQTPGGDAASDSVDAAIAVTMRERFQDAANLVGQLADVIEQLRADLNRLERCP